MTTMTISDRLVQGKMCRCCRQWKPHNQFPCLAPADDTTPLRFLLKYGFTNYCNACRCDDHANENFAARDDAIERNQFPWQVSWARETERRSKEQRRQWEQAGGKKITASEWQELKKQHEHRCLWCGRAEPEITLVKDHIVAVSAGGRNDLLNIQPLCQSCNATKSDETLDLRDSVKRQDRIANWHARRGIGSLVLAEQALGVSVAAATRIVGMSRTSLYRRIRCGNLRTMRRGGQILIPHAEINRLLCASST